MQLTKTWAILYYQVQLGSKSPLKKSTYYIVKTTPSYRLLSSQSFSLIYQAQKAIYLLTEAISNSQPSQSCAIYLCHNLFYES